MYTIGFAGEYIHEEKTRFTPICEIPKEVASLWGKSVIKEGNYKRMLVDDDKWLNKMFVIVGREHKFWVAIYNCDDKYYLFQGLDLDVNDPL